jgi:hypothetical protein
MFPRLSVALITNVLKVSIATESGIPEIVPNSSITRKSGNEPLISEYEILVAGRTGVAIN